MVFEWHDRKSGLPGGERLRMAIDLSLAIGEPIFPAIESVVRPMLAKGKKNGNREKNKHR
jgi:hypothetical protein